MATTKEVAKKESKEVEAKDLPDEVPVVELPKDGDPAPSHWSPVRETRLAYAFWNDGACKVGSTVHAQGAWLVRTEDGTFLAIEGDEFIDRFVPVPPSKVDQVF